MTLNLHKIRLPLEPPLRKMKIDTGNSEPVSQKPYWGAMKHYQWVKDEINKPIMAKEMRKSIKLVSTHHSCPQR